ncbi:hypothetical protein B0H12DRAFT_1289038 [Mycena haematopus]|nr:hypothetical protein B0H12DRAFT_1289038 [Mycena haematopus]
MALWRALLRLLPRSTHQDDTVASPPLLPFLHLATTSAPARFDSASIIIGVLLSGIPPTYNDIRTYEVKLPQNNLSAVFVQDERTFLRFPGHVWGRGLNNVLQEALVMGYLAHLTGRVYVFEDYTWSHLPLRYTVYDYALRPTQIPLNAFVAGPLAGGPLPAPEENAVHKRAVSAAFFEQACPRTEIPAALVGWWVERLRSVHGVRCVEIDSSAQTVFDFLLFGSPRVLSLLPGLNASPILGAFAWSPLVHSAVVRNFALLRPTDPAMLYPPRRPFAHSAADTNSYLFSSSSSAIIPDAHRTLTGLVAVHLRRGDYQGHCTHLARWAPATWATNSTPAAKEAYYLQHCLPTPDQLAARLHIVRREHAERHPRGAPLSRVYVLTNGRGSFVDSVRKELLRDGWDEVWGSGDLVLDAAQAGVGMAVDMRIGEGAEVFLGNGFSSLTSNVVMLRLARGLEPESNRFL